MSLCGFLTAFAPHVLMQTQLASLQLDVTSVLVPTQGSGNDYKGKEPRGRWARL